MLYRPVLYEFFNYRGTSPVSRQERTRVWCKSGVSREEMSRICACFTGATHQHYQHLVVYSGISGVTVLRGDGCVFYSLLLFHVCALPFHPAELIRAGQIPQPGKPAQEPSCWVQYATCFPGNASPVGLRGPPWCLVRIKTKTYASSK